jgi:S-adenosylmethionine-diacylgycerolhomoserine-N-methlytransferase
MADLNPPRIDFRPPSSLANDASVLRSMLFAEIKGDTHEEHLESFYVTQSDLYDSYRYRMLHGRFPMICAMPAPKGGIWVDLGGGTGSNLEFFGPNLSHFSKVVVLDLCPSLVKTAQKRVDEKGWSSFVDVVLGDACDFEVRNIKENDHCMDYIHSENCNYVFLTF